MYIEYINNYLYQRYVTVCQSLCCHKIKSNSVTPWGPWVSNPYSFDKVTGGNWEIVSIY